MIKLFPSIAGFILLTLLLACSPSPATMVIADLDYEFRQLDTLHVTAGRLSDTESLKNRIEKFENRTFEGTYEKTAKLIHTVLDLSFRWEERVVEGKADLILTPFFADISQVRLDAKNFLFHSLRMGQDGPELDYEYDGVELFIKLDRTYTRGDTFNIRIEYDAFPYEQRPDGFQPAAIQRGIYFINYKGDELHKPMQIWTQGQTEYNSNWFPTIDKPNVRTTQETYLTVDDRFTTLTNGLLKESVQLDNGMRRDYWVMDQEHPPYLFMLAIGEYVIVEDEWRGIPIEYFVEAEYEKYAADIFGNTKEMLDYFSDITGIEYPWQKYSQVVVRDFVAGAMENTTAVIFGEQVQRPLIDLRDRNNDGIVAHELIHHWFGNLLTCKNWANLTLNEGFASFTEMLWEEYKRGPDAAGELRLDKLNAYFAETANFVRPLINYGYSDNEDMFDRHSYNKGGLILQMLRNKLGDDAYFASWQKYLKDHYNSPVEVHDLRLSFESASGRDLFEFFEQWFFRKGHPQLEVETQYDSNSATVGLIIRQVQDAVVWHPVFRFPVKVDIHLKDGSTIELDMEIGRRETVLLLDCPSPPVWVNFDRDKYLLAEVWMERDFDSYLAQYQLGATFQDRHQAILGLRNHFEKIPRELFAQFIHDGSARIRMIALEAFGGHYVEEKFDLLSEMALSDSNALVRAAVMNTVADFEHPFAEDLAVKILDQGYSASGISAALSALAELNPERAMLYAEGLENSLSRTVLMSLASLYAEEGGVEQIPFFQDNYYRIRGFAISNYFARFSEMLVNMPADLSILQLEWLEERAVDQREESLVRYGAATTISKLKEFFIEKERQGADIPENAVGLLEQSLERILASEQNPRLQNMIRNLIGR